jgi:hypothetical protein
MTTFALVCKMYIRVLLFGLYWFKGIVQRKLRGVESGISRQVLL